MERVQHTLSAGASFCKGTNSVVVFLDFARIIRGKLNRTWRMVFSKVGAIHLILQAFTSCLYCPDQDFTTCNLDHALRFFQ